MHFSQLMLGTIDGHWATRGAARIRISLREQIHGAGRAQAVQPSSVLAYS